MNDLELAEKASTGEDTLSISSPYYFEIEGAQAEGSGQEGDVEFPSEFHYGQVGHRAEDHSWSVISNSFFLAGGVSYLTLSIWDLHEPQPLGVALVCYKSITAFGAFVYLFDSMIDISWARVVQVRQKKKRYREKVMLDAINSQDKDDPEEVPRKKKKRTFFRRVRKHAGHRRALLSALFFGIASFLAVLDWCVDSSYIPSLLPFFSMSTHAYLVSAIFAITGTRSRPWCFAFSLGDADTLEDMGDIFFMVGSVVDVLLCDFHFDDKGGGWAVMSSFLWCLDACLYLWSDAVFKEALRQEKSEFYQKLEGDGDDYTVISEGGSKLDSHLLGMKGTTASTCT